MLAPMTRPRRPPPLAALAAFLARGRLWLCEALVWLAAIAGVPRAVRADIIEDLRGLRRVVALHAFLAAPLIVRTGRAGGARPPNAPRGMRRSRARRGLRMLWRLTRQGVGLRARLEALRAAIDNPSAVAARLRKLLRRRFQIAAYVLAVAPCEALAPRACPAVARRDSS